MHLRTSRKPSLKRLEAIKDIEIDPADQSRNLLGKTSANSTISVAEDDLPTSYSEIFQPTKELRQDGKMVPLELPLASTEDSSPAQDPIVME